jgi:UDP-N-acetylmuramate dehydrogenase
MDRLSAAIEAVKKQLPEIKLRLDEPMKNHTSFKIGGTVSAMFFPASQAELARLCCLLSDVQCKPLIMGNGTNLLVEDGVLELLVIKTNGGMGSIALTGENEITAESGALLSKLAVFAQKHGLAGFEFAHGIPGTLGGAVSMNAGAYGGEIRDVVASTTAIDAGAGSSSWSGPNVLRGEEQEFSYRHSRFSDTDSVLLSSVLKLKPGQPEEIKARMDELSSKRCASQPLNLPSAGSTFKRPKNGYAAALIEQAGLKGYSVGGAQVSEKHSGFVVNTGGASFSDVMAVMEHVREEVLRQFGTELEPEVKIIRSNALREG